jgi:integrase
MQYRGRRRSSKGAQLYLRDAKRPGGVRRWVILDRSSSGQRVERSTGAFEGDRAKAEKAFAEYLAEKHVPSFGGGHPAQVLIVDVLAHYGENKVTTATRQQDKLAATLLNLGTFFADKTIDDITPQLCDDYVKWRIGQGDIRFTLDKTKRGRALKPSTARNDLIVLQAAQNYCFANRKLTHVVKITKPPPSSPRPRMLSRDEAARLLAGALGWDEHGRRHEKRINRHLARFILIGIYSGTRSDRIRRLQWVENMQGGCVDLDKGDLHRKAATEAETKKRAPSVPLGNRLLQHMRRWRRQTARYVIECYGRPVTDSLGTAFDGALELAGMWLPPEDPNRVTPHTTRHTCVSWMLEDGKTPFQVGKYVGMTAAMVERVYGHVSDDQQRDTANSIGRRNIPRPSHTGPTNRMKRA